MDAFFAITYIAVAGFAAYQILTSTAIKTLVNKGVVTASELLQKLGSSIKIPASLYDIYIENEK